MEETAALRKAAPSWSLAGDRQLFNTLQSMHERIISKCRDADSRLTEIMAALSHANVALRNVNDTFTGLSNTQFIERRVYEDDIEDLQPDTGQTKEPPKPQPPSEREEIEEALRVLHSMHETVTILDSDSDSDSDGEEPRVVLKSRDLYADRPLPYIIGSQQWKAKWHAGLVREDSDSESSHSGSERDNLSEQYSDSGPEYLPDTHTKVSPASSEPIARLETSALPPALVAANIAQRLAQTHVLNKIPQEEEYSPEPTVRKTYRPEKPAPGTIFPDEPPPLEATSSSAEDIFAELQRDQHRSQRQHKHEHESRHADLFGTNQATDLFDQNYEGDIFSDFAKPPLNSTANVKPKSTLFDEESEPELFVEKPKPSEERTRSEDSERLKKPVGGISVFGAKTSESIGAAILKRKQRQSSTSGDESDETPQSNKPKTTIKPRTVDKKASLLTKKISPENENPQIIKKKEIDNRKVTEAPQSRKPEINKDIFEDLFAKSAKIQKKEKDAIQEERVSSVKKDNIKKVDLFSDNLFDDIDDIFTSNIIKTTKIENVHEKPIFDDDDDLFADIATVTTSKNTVKENDNKSKSGKSNKSIFDSDDELFSDKVEVSKPEPKIDRVSQSKTSVKESLFDSDDDIFFNAAKRKENSTYTEEIPANDNSLANQRTEDNREKMNKNSTRKEFNSINKEDDIFFDKSNNTTSNEQEKQSVTVKTSSNVFGDDDDLFTTNTKKVVKSDDVIVKDNTNVFSEQITILKNTKIISDEISENYNRNLEKETSENVSRDLDKDNKYEQPKDNNNKSDANSLINDTLNKKEKFHQNDEKVLPRSNENYEDVDDWDTSDRIEEEQGVQGVSSSNLQNIFKNPIQDVFQDDSVDIFTVKINKSITKYTSDANKTQLLDENATNDEDLFKSSEDIKTADKISEQHKPTIAEKPQLPRETEKDKANSENKKESMSKEAQNQLDIKTRSRENSSNEHFIEKQISEPILKAPSEMTDVKNKDLDHINESFDDLFGGPPPLRETKPKDDLFTDIFNNQPPVFEKPKEPKRSKNVNALFDDDSDDEALFFKKNDVVLHENPEEFSPSLSGGRFDIFPDEPPAIDVDLEQDYQESKTKGNESNKDFADNLTETVKDNRENNTGKIFNKQSEEVKNEFAEDNKNNHNRETDDFDDIFNDGVDIGTVKINKDTENARSKQVESEVVTMQSDTEQIDKTDGAFVEPKKIGKLKPMGLNINVNTLLPRASPKKTSKVEQFDGQSISSKSNEELRSSGEIRLDNKSKLVKAVSFEENPDSLLLDNKLSKERAKIQVKRRPSTRRARREAVKKSGIDFGPDSTDNSSSIHDHLSQSEKHKIQDISLEDESQINKDVDENNIFKDFTDSNIEKDCKKDLVSPKVRSDISVERDMEKNIKSNDNTGQIGDSSVTRNKENPTDLFETVKSPTRDVKSKIVYILNDEDIFNVKPETSRNQVENSNIDTEVTESNKISKIRDDDDDLFKTTTDSSIISKTVVINSKKSVVDLDEGEDIFKTMTSKPSNKDSAIVTLSKSENVLTKAKSVLDLSEDEDDIFKTNKTQNVEQKTLKSKDTNIIDKPIDTSDNEVLRQTIESEVSETSIKGDALVKNVEHKTVKSDTNIIHKSIDSTDNKVLQKTIETKVTEKSTKEDTLVESDDDIFKDFVQTNKTKQDVKNVTTKPVLVTTEASVPKVDTSVPKLETNLPKSDTILPKSEKQKTKPSIFDDLSDEESELFAKIKKAPKVTENKVLFGSDSEDDLFSSKKKRGDKKEIVNDSIVKEEKGKKIEVKGSLFGDDDDDDLFGVKTTKIAKSRQSSIPTKETAKSSQPVVHDPLSLFGDDD